FSDVVFGLHRLADSLQHEPRCFLSDSKSAMNFHTADSILAVREHPKSGHPLIHANRRILKDRSNLEGELLLAVIAKPDSPRFDKRVFLAIAAGTCNLPIRPAQLHGIVKAALLIGEVNNRFLQSPWFRHVSHIFHLTEPE